MIDVVRTQLARFESHLQAELREARRDLNQAHRRVQEVEAEIAMVREALDRRKYEQQELLVESRAGGPEAVSPHKERAS